MNIYITILTGVVGLIIGFLAQRSRMCFVAGLRDYILARDRELLLGLLAFLVTVWFLTSIFYSLNLLKKGMPEYGELEMGTQIEKLSTGVNWVQNVRDIKLLGDKMNPQFFNPFFIVTLSGGWLIGILSTLSGGCVLRQHVLSVQGNRDSMFYLFGFYAAVVVYYLFLSKIFTRIY